MCARLLLCVGVCVFTLQAAYAQTNVRLFSNPEAYKANSFTIESLSVEQNKKRNSIAQGHNAFIMSADNKQGRAALKENWAIEYNDTLYLNSDVIKDNIVSIYSNVFRFESGGYTKVLYRSSRFMCFRLNTIGKRKEKSIRMAVSDALSNVQVAMKSNEYDCILDLETNKVHILNGLLMEDLLAAKPNLQKAYVNAGSPENMEVYIECLRRLP